MTPAQRFHAILARVVAREQTPPPPTQRLNREWGKVPGRRTKPGWAWRRRET